MAILTIDNTRTAGNFFDNIFNDTMLVHEYDLNYLDEIKEDLNINDKTLLYINENTSIIKNYNQKYKHKYNYINTDTLNNYINPLYEKIYNEQYKTMFTLTPEQFKQYCDFIQEHKNHLYDIVDKKQKYGTIEGGIILEYKINYNYEDKLPFFKFVKCLACNITEELNDKTKNFVLDDKLLLSYDNHCKFGVKFDKVEFYRFMEIYHEYKEPLIINFISTGGIGNTVIVKTNEYIFDITNIDNW